MPSSNFTRNTTPGRALLVLQWDFVKQQARGGLGEENCAQITQVVRGSVGTVRGFDGLNNGALKIRITYALKLHLQAEADAGANAVEPRGLTGFLPEFFPQTEPRRQPRWWRG